MKKRNIFGTFEMPDFVHLAILLPKILIFLSQMFVLRVDSQSLQGFFFLRILSLTLIFADFAPTSFLIDFFIPAKNGGSKQPIFFPRTHPISG